MKIITSDDQLRRLIPHVLATVEGEAMDEPSDEIERSNLTARLGRSAMPLRLSKNFRF